MPEDLEDEGDLGGGRHQESFKATTGSRSEALRAGNDVGETGPTYAAAAPLAQSAGDALTLKYLDGGGDPESLSPERAQQLGLLPQGWLGGAFLASGARRPGRRRTRGPEA